MRSCLDEETILDFIGGRLSGSAIAAVERHAARCPRCVKLIAQAGMLESTLFDESRTVQGRARSRSENPVETLPRELSEAHVARPLGSHRLLQPLGRGGMGIVYRAVHEASGQKVALKTVHARTPASVASIRREVHALSRLSHPGVVRVLEQGVDDGLPWYSMELIEGQTLAEHLSRRAPEEAARAPDRALLGVLCRLARTLAFLHGRGIVHRDLTPRNVVIRPDGSPVLVDFGLSTRDDRPGHDLLGAVANVGGTPLYMAPEQIRGELLDARSDLYSLGCILYETLTGHPPYESESLGLLLFRQLHDVPVPPSARAAHVDAALESLILRLLAKSPRDRIGYAEDVAMALLPFSDPATQALAEERATAYVYRPELTGRAEQFASFEERLQRLLGEGRGDQVFLSGESGVGKTRFVAELSRRARGRGVAVVVGECVALGTRPESDTERSTALRPLRPLLQAVLERCAGSLPRSERIVGPRGKLLAAYEPALLDLPGQSAQPEPPALSGQAARYRLLSALHEMVAALAAEVPLLLVIDDLQWADELSLDFLDSFPSGFFDQHRALIVGTFRSEDVTARLQRLVGAPRTQTVTLGRFDAAELERLVSDMLVLDTVPPELLAPLIAASEGSPFLASEYLRAAVEEGIIVRDVGARWRLDAERYAAKRLPGSLRELIDRRLATLSAPTRQLIEVASVLGRQVESSVLLATAGLTETEGMDALKELVARAFLEEADGDLFRFVHDKLREVAYEAVDAERRCALHRRAALVIEARGSAVDPSHAHPLLAYHFTRGGLPSRAIDHLEKAGELALTMAAYAEAAGFFQRAVELAANLREGEGAAIEPQRVARWQRRLGEAFYALGDLSRCAVHSSRVLAASGHPLPSSRGAWAIELGRQLGRQIRSALLPGRPLAGSPAEREQMHEAALAAARIAYYYYFAHDGLALAAVSLLSVNLAELASDDVHMARPYAQVGYLSGMFRLRSVADRYFARAQRSAQATGQPDELASALSLEASYHVGEGAWDRARTIGLRALRQLEEINNPQECEIIHTILAHAEYCAGRYADSTARCELLSASARSRNNARHHAWGLYAGARSLIRLGRFDEALERLGQARALLVSQPELPSELLCLSLAAAAHLERGDLAMAERTADHGLELANSTLAVFTVGDAYVSLADVYLTLAERHQRAGDRIPDPLRSRMERACAALRRFAMIFPIGQPSALLAAGRRHLLAGRPHQAEHSFERALERARVLSMPYEQAMADLLLGRHGLSERAREHHIKAARDGFERLGCALTKLDQ